VITANPCGSWLASDEVGTVDHDVGCADAIAGKSALTGFFSEFKGCVSLCIAVAEGYMG
jgi:hypothetical protein